MCEICTQQKQSLSSYSYGATVLHACLLVTQIWVEYTALHYYEAQGSDSINITGAYHAQAISLLFQLQPTVAAGKSASSLTPRVFNA